jgi:hypothetical protein
MKTKMMIVVFMLLASFFAKAEKTFRHDHAVCKVQGEKIEFEILSKLEFTSSEDDEYGEVIILKHKGKNIEVVLNDSGMGRYRLLRGENNVCGKLLAMKRKENEAAFFFLKDNRPFPDTVIVLYYNVKSQEVDFMPSKIQAKVGFFSEGKVFLKFASSDRTEKFSNVVINGQKFTTFEKTLEPWISFDGKNFKLDRDMTYERFEYKDLLKKSSLNDLDEFKENKYQIAANPSLKKSCISLNNSEWTCRPP